jgi:hypothetical protein
LGLVKPGERVWNHDWKASWKRAMSNAKAEIHSSIQIDILVGKVAVRDKSSYVTAPLVVEHLRAHSTTISDEMTHTSQITGCEELQRGVHYLRQLYHRTSDIHELPGDSNGELTLWKVRGTQKSSKLHTVPPLFDNPTYKRYLAHPDKEHLEALLSYMRRNHNVNLPEGYTYDNMIADKKLSPNRKQAMDFSELNAFVFFPFILNLCCKIENPLFSWEKDFGVLEPQLKYILHYCISTAFGWPLKMPPLNVNEEKIPYASNPVSFFDENNTAITAAMFVMNLIHGGLAFDALDELEKMLDANDVANHGISGRELLSTFGKRSTRLFDVLIAVNLNHFAL